MLSKTYSFGLFGLEAYPITIEIDVSRGLPSTLIVGLPDSAVKESKERVRAAIKNSGFKYAKGRVTINLSPANTKKEGPAFDLAIALGILAASEQIDPKNLDKYALLGELSLDGNIQPIHGVLPIALSLKNTHFKSLICPSANAQEAALAQGVDIIPVKNLEEAIQFIHDPTLIASIKTDYNITTQAPSSHLDFCDVKGQLHVKRGLEIAAAGAHNCMMIGPPGVGKSMLAKRFPTILPDMNLDEALETTNIYSISGLLKKNRGLLRQRPFRSPHHTTSAAAIVGGGSTPKPGEITLSHNGVLFLDEFPEFSRSVLESLRQPLEDQEVTIARANKTLRFPCRFILLAAMNPSPSGKWHDPNISTYQMQRYLSKLSGPLMDRIDLHLDVPNLSAQDLIHYKPGESSQAIKERTTAARHIQSERLKGSSLHTNAQMNHKQIKKYCELNKESQLLLNQAIKELNLSARAYDKILKIARTIADLAACDFILTEHIAEAIQFRSLDRKWS